jgi:hypothetical protein
VEEGIMDSGNRKNEFSMLFWPSSVERSADLDAPFYERGNRIRDVE